MLVSEPETYGLSGEQTLGHRVERDPPADFEPYWSDWREEVATLSSRWAGRVDDDVGELVIPSLRSVRVVARLTVPTAAPRGLVVTTHGSAAPAAFPEGGEPWSASGLATLRLRVRGYPPSTLDIDDRREDWILHHIDSAAAWIMRGAVADVVQAVRCAAQHFGRDLPIGLHGESFGGGLAVMAAAQLAALARDGDGVARAPHRLVIGLPSFGDWAWRADRYCNGMGGLVNERLVALREDSSRVMGTLLLFDAAHHAAGVTCPTLAKLAERDDVVPAPSAAAVFNALAAGDRWRFVTRFGHFDGGTADLRRHARFEQIHPPFLDPAVRPEDAVAKTAERMSR